MTFTNWSYLPAGYARTLVFLPGWATDARVLQREKLHWDVIVPKQAEVLPDILNTLEEMLLTTKLKSVTVVGWSMGGNLAIDFTKRFPQYVDKLFLASMRRQYPENQIAGMIADLQLKTEQTLRSFYRQMFFPTQMVDYRTFRTELEKDFLHVFSRVDLITGLLLLQQPLDEREKISCPIAMLHGIADVIAPVNEAINLSEEMGADFSMLNEASHALPWCDDFYRIINE